MGKRSRYSQNVRNVMIQYLKKKTGIVAFAGYCPSNKELLARCESLLRLPVVHGMNKRQRMDQVMISLGHSVPPISETVGQKKKRQKRFRRKDPHPFYHSDAWMRLRYQVLVANDGRCECCGRNKHNGVVLHVDHIKPRSKYPELEWEISNLQVLCEECNLGKMAWDETDWREPSLRVLMGEDAK